MKAIFEFLAARGSFPVLATVFASFVASVLLNGLGALDVLCVLAIASFQMYLQLHNEFHVRLVPVEWLKQQSVLKTSEFYRRGAWLLALAPLLFVAGRVYAWIYLALAVLVYGQSLLNLAQRFLNRKALSKAATDKLSEYRPEVVVYVSGFENVAYQINQWLPVLERLDCRVAVLARQAEIFAGMPSTPVPVFFARNAAHVEQVLNCGVKTVLYPANPMQNFIALRHYSLNHFFINHGESDKAVNQSKLLMAYDKLLVGGRLAHSRLLEAGLKPREDQVAYVGRPQAEIALKQVTPGEGGQIKSVLYAPTWEGFVEHANYSSINEFGLEMLRSLAAKKKWQLTFKPHPYTGTRSGAARRAYEQMLAFCRQEGIDVVDSLVSIHDCMNQSDLLITDISSVLNEYLVTRKPVVLCVPEQLSGQDLSSAYPSSAAAYHLSDPARADTLIKSISEHDELCEQRDATRKDSLGDFEEGALERFKFVISESLKDAV